MRIHLTTQILIAPLMVVIILLALLVLTQWQLQAMRSANDSIRQQTELVSTLKATVQGATNLDQLAGYIEWTLDNSAENKSALDDFHFRYLEQCRSLQADLGHELLAQTLTSKDLEFIGQRLLEVEFQQPLDTDNVRISLAELIPRLDSLYSYYSAQKRLAYTGYYREVDAITDRLANFSFWSLVVAVFAALGISVWSIRRIRRRLQTVAAEAGAVCPQVSPSLFRLDSADELDQLGHCLHTMQRRLVDVVGAEKLLQGAEEERRRLAMDLHDQLLGDVTSLLRRIRALPQDVKTCSDLRALEAEVEELMVSIRQVIEDLHPQTLDILGLEAALRAYLDKRLHADSPHYFLHIDPQTAQLSAFLQLNLYRIILEAVQNIIRHAHAERYEIDCQITDGVLFLSVDDNGQGWPKRKTEHGYGLNNMRQRAQAIGASLEFTTSRFAHGAALRLKLSLPAS